MLKPRLPARATVHFYKRKRAFNKTQNMFIKAAGGFIKNCLPRQERGGRAFVSVGARQTDPQAFEKLKIALVGVGVGCSLLRNTVGGALRIKWCPPVNVKKRSRVLTARRTARVSLGLSNCKTEPTTSNVCSPVKGRLGTTPGH